MSPALRSMLEDAADDGGRPVALDLGEVRRAGRRATWQRRAVVGGSGLGAAAVVTAVALVVSSPGGLPFGPAGPVATETPHSIVATAGSGEPEFGDLDRPELAPFVDALAARGYELQPGGGLGVEGAGEDGAEPAWMRAMTVAVLDGDQVGGASLAEFTDIALLGDGTWVPYDTDAPNPQCAIPPTSGGSGTVWTWSSCGMHVDGTEAPDFWFASGGDQGGEAMGVTLVRDDGSGISASFSAAVLDEYADWSESPPQPMDDLPFTHVELVDVLTALDANAPLFEQEFMYPQLPPDGIPCGEVLGEAVPEPTSSSLTVPPEDGEAYESDCTIEIPGDGIDAGAFYDWMPSAGIDAVELGGTGSGSSSDDPAPEVASSVLFELTDADGRRGMASIGVATSIETAPMMNDTSAPWCAVTPTYESNFAWQLSAENPASCTHADHVPGVPLVVVHQEPGADAIGATLVRLDGSVISVSISRSPGMPSPDEPIHSAGLLSLPLDAAAMLDLLAALDAANPPA